MHYPAYLYKLFLWLGQWKSYTFSLKLETALTEASDKSSTPHACNVVTIDCSIVIHNHWDDFHKVPTIIYGWNKTNSVTGGAL